MDKFTVITENDESMWEDITGQSYHFPHRYINYLEPGTKIVYYKGKMKNSYYREFRLSPEPHYFGTAEISSVRPDTESYKGDLFAELIKFKKFISPVHFRINGEYIEQIPESRATNYWRDGVRPISEDVYLRIIELSESADDYSDVSRADHEVNTPMPSSGGEGALLHSISTTYERDPMLREMAMKIHGLNCKVCGFNFEEKYGVLGKGFIHVHHTTPPATTGEVRINPVTDLTVLCANCHYMVHRKKGLTLSVDELKRKLNR